MRHFLSFRIHIWLSQSAATDGDDINYLYIYWQCRRQGWISISVCSNMWENKSCSIIIILIRRLVWVLWDNVWREVYERIREVLNDRKKTRRSTETFAFIVDSTVKPKDANQTSISTKTRSGTSTNVISSRSKLEKNSYLASTKPNQNVVSALK